MPNRRRQPSVLYKLLQKKIVAAMFVIDLLLYTHTLLTNNCNVTS